jgi:hypothetical protein
MVPKKIGQRLGRAMSPDFVNGNPIARPKGIVPTSVVGSAGATGTATCITYPAVHLIHSVDAACRQLGNCWFLLHDVTETSRTSTAIGDHEALAGFLDHCARRRQRRGYHHRHRRHTTITLSSLLQAGP